MRKGSKRTEKRGMVLPFTPSGDVYYRKGMSMYHRGRLDKALKYLQRARELEPEEPMIPLQMAIIQTEIGEFQQSNELLEMIMETIDPSMTESHYFIANNYAHLGLFQEAYKHATAYLDQNQDGEFVEDAEDLLDLLSLEDDDEFDPDFKQDELIIQQEKARKLLEEGNFKEAIEILEDVIERFPDYWSAYNNLALAYFYFGDADQATALLTDVLNRNTGNLHALCNLAVFYHYQQRTDELKQLMDSLEHVRPFLFEHRFKLGATFALVGRHEQAYAWLKSLVKRGFEGDAGFYFWLAHSAWHSGHEKVARDAWKRVIAEQPEKDGMEPWGDQSPAEHLPSPSPIEQHSLDMKKSQYPEERMFKMFKAFLSKNRSALFRLNQKSLPSFLTYIEKDYYSLLADTIHQQKEQPQANDASYKALKRAHDVGCLLHKTHAANNQANEGLYYMWFHIFYHGRMAEYSFKNVQALSAAVEFVWKKLRGEAVTQKEMASKYSIASATVRKYVNEVDAFLP
ncbi:tetratricopeptide repeat protein [Jeotgalibacillus soli]|uniref:Uncharacterized protein n=1 Tax=Jeotgalibacillus soli TaxID=889306 RepID=A0A0C2S7K7_9BACL|nr:tetratricopeptide repeat protein [Jeotgalibacillus soli]KIL49989.1 hypothetical protein KP78_14570 [Jeotgalibacillus soli]